MAHDKFAPDGTLKDEMAAKLIRQLLEALAEWTTRIGHGQKA